jgi:micrococcal nuclease
MISVTSANDIPLFGEVVKIIDGDTTDIRFLDGTIHRIRYLGIQAPELSGVSPCERHQAKAAMQANAALVLGQTIRLELDRQARDKYGRLLAYVFVGELMVNAELLRQGYAVARPVTPNVRERERFKAMEAEAKAAKRGVWGE